MPAPPLTAIEGLDSLGRPWLCVGSTDEEIDRMLRRCLKLGLLRRSEGDGRGPLRRGEYTAWALDRRPAP
jgi:hypothetical protein